MAYRSINTPMSVNREDFLNLYDRLRVKDFVNALVAIMKTESIPINVVSEVEASLYNCVYSFTSTYRLLKEDNSRTEFRDASKRHQRTLNSILTYVVQSVKTSGISTNICLRNNTIDIKIDSSVVLSQVVQPRSFRSWYNALWVLRLVNKGLSTDNTIVICRVLASLYNIVNEPELRESERNRMVNELVDTIECSKYSSISDFKDSNRNEDPTIQKGIEELKETVSTIKYYVSHVRENPPKWASDLVRSLRLLHRNERFFVYDNTKPMLSCNSTCTTIVRSGKRITIPGLFASVLEDDYYRIYNPDSKLDDIISFKQEYCINNDFRKSLNSSSKRRFSVSIKQKKPKPRIIHPLNNSEQDRLNYFHNLLSRVLSNIRSDCTFDQAKGPKRLKTVMETESGKSIYSLDLTNATDTFSLGLQWIIMKDLIFCDKDFSTVVSDEWLRIMTSSSCIKVDNRQRIFSFNNGQPQGFLSSFPSFALEHHICMLTVLRLTHPEMNPSDFYNVLGDDGAITCYDESFIVPKTYKWILQSANVECNLQKGYLYNPDIPEYSVKIAEFAKYLILDGTEVTPIPTKLLVTEDKFSNYIALAAWYSDHRESKWSPGNLKYFLEICDKSSCEYYSPLIDTMVNLNIPSVFSRSFEPKFDRLISGHTADDLAICQELLANTLIFASINRLINSRSKLEISKGGLAHVTRELKPILDAIDDKTIVSPWNKLSTLMDEVYNTFTTFREVTSRYSSFKDVSEDEILIICLILQTSNDTMIKDNLNKVFQGMEILTLDPYDLKYSSDMDGYMDKTLELFNNFNISIERSWSSYSKFAPQEYLNTSVKVLNDLLLKRGKSLSEFVLTNELTILSSPVETRLDGIDFESGIDFGTFTSYRDEDWYVEF